MNGHVHPAFRSALEAICPPEDIKVQPTRGVSTTEYRIVGALPSVMSAIAEMFAKFHPYGYDTRVHSLEMIEGEKYAARLSHLNSCE